MRRHDDFEQCMFAARHHRIEVAFQYGLERLCIGPFRMIRSKCLDTIEGKQHLKVERLLRPQRAVIVKHGNTFGRRDIVRAFG